MGKCNVRSGFSRGDLIGGDHFDGDVERVEVVALSVGEYPVFQVFAGRAGGHCIHYNLNFIIGFDRLAQVIFVALMEFAAGGAEEAVFVVRCPGGCAGILQPPDDVKSGAGNHQRAVRRILASAAGRRKLYGRHRILRLA